MTKRKGIDAAVVVKAYQSYMEQHPPTTITMPQWEQLAPVEQARFRAEGMVESHRLRAEAYAVVAKRLGATVETVRAACEPAASPSYWLTDHPTTPEAIATRAQVLCEANPARAGGTAWHEARRLAMLTRRAIDAGDAAGSVWAALEMLRHTVRAELLEGPLPMLVELQSRPRNISAKGGRNKPKPEWWPKAVLHAKTLKATGKESHELAALCARKFNVSADAARRCLQAAGLVEKKSRG